MQTTLTVGIPAVCLVMYYKLIHVAMNEKEAISKCLDCEDTGKITIPAYNTGGEIINEDTFECVCILTKE